MSKGYKKRLEKELRENWHNPEYRNSWLETSAELNKAY